MNETKSPQSDLVRLRMAGWTGFFSALATVAAVVVGLFFWAEGSVIGAVIALCIGIIAAATLVLTITAAKRKGRDSNLNDRTNRLRRARYRSAYPPAEGNE